MGVNYQLGLFVLAAVVIWIGSNRLSKLVEFIDKTYQLGDAFGGTILLSLATNIPEIIIVVRGVQQGDTSIALGNVLGGIAMQTLLLVLFDFASRKNKAPLSTLASHKNSLIQGAFLCIILSLVIMGAQFRPVFVDYPISPIETIILLSWLICLYLLKKGEQNKVIPKIENKEKHGVNFTKTHAWIEFAFILILVGFFGVILANTSEFIASYFNMDGVIFGATALAFITSLPEISSGLAFVRLKNYTPIISDIYGGNSFLPTLFLLANILAGKSILTDAHKTDLYLVGLSLILTLLFSIGMIVKVKKRYLLLGLESWVMLIVYAIAIIGLLII